MNSKYVKCDFFTTLSGIGPHEYIVDWRQIDKILIVRTDARENDALEPT